MVHSFPEIYQAKLPALKEIQISPEKQSTQTEQSQGSSFTDHLQSRTQETVQPKNETVSSDIKEKRSAEPVSEPEKKRPADKDTAAVNNETPHKDLKTNESSNPASKDSSEIAKNGAKEASSEKTIKKSSLAEIAVKKNIETQHGEPIKKSPKKKHEDTAEIEQGLAGIVAAVEHHIEKLSSKQTDVKETASQRDSLLKKIKTLTQQIVKAEEEPAIPVEEKRSMQKAQKFLAQFELMLKNPAAKEFKKETLAGISDGLKKELSALKDSAEKHSKQNVHSIAHHDIRNEKPADATSSKDGSIQKENSPQAIAASGSSAKNESDSSSQFSFMKHATGRDSSSSVKDASSSLSKPFPFSENIDELISKAKVTVRDAQNGSLSLRMFPEHLGRVNINLGLENGILTAKFLVDSADAKEALNANIAVLKDALSQEGISVGQFQVDVRGGGSQQAHNEDDHQKNASRSITGEQEQASREYEIHHASTHNGLIDMVI